MPDNTSQEVLERLIQMNQDARNNILINTVVKSTVGQILSSVEDPNIQLKVKDIRVVEKFDNKDINKQKEVRNKGQMWANDIRADLELIDKKTNKVVDKVDNMKIADVPKITDRGTFLIGGNEYQFSKQARLKPGVYTKRQKNGEISSFFNVDKTIDFDRGFNNNFKIEFDPEKKLFSMAYGTKHVPLINALRTVGITDKELEASWGKDVFEINSMAYGRQQDINQKKLYSAIFGKLPGAEIKPMDVATQIRDRLFATKLDPHVTEITLGKPYTDVNKNAILDASKKIIDINRGIAEEDDRESLIFKSFYDIEDHMREKLVKNSAKIINNIKFKLNKSRSIGKSLSPQTSFNPYIVGTVTNSQLSNPPNQTNPMSIISEGSKFTVMGEGGIGSPNAITNEARQISNSEVGFVDPLHTADGGNIGVAVHTTMDTIKIGNDLYSKFLKPNGKPILLRPIDVYKKNIAFPDQFENKNGKLIPISGKIKVIKEGKFDEVGHKDVDFVIASPIGMFDTSANSVPFLDSIQGNRGQTASKMQEQALSLKHRDKPLFKVINDDGSPIAEYLAKAIAVPRSPVDGVVKSVHNDKIIITSKGGKDHEIPLYHNFSLNAESYLHNEPKVSAGDKVKKDDLLADNNFTKDGQMALGANLHVAYIPYKGFNYEDSAVMSESAAKKLTSQHMYDLKTKRTAKGIFSLNKYKAYYPEELTSANMKKLDKDGVILPGQKVERDDIVIAHLERKTPSADDVAIGRLDKQLKRDMSDNAVRWENDHVGIVTNVEKSGNSVVVNIKTEEPMKVADKISGLHGNKHIISKILPDNEMPFNQTTGKYIDLTMSPVGVSNRINTSQLLENAAGKIAWKTGKQYEIKNFAPVDNSRKIMKDLADAGLSDKDILIDPETKQPYKNPVSAGFSHILKLEHKVDHKYSARYRDQYDSNEQPNSGGETGGKNLGRMEMAALLARGANENLKEMFNIKGQRNDEYWKAMETGQSLPPPNRAFVWDKMLAMMAGSGINVQQKGKSFVLKPLTDKEIIEKSRGELLNPTDTYRMKDMSPIKEGLFDPIKAGGIFGDHFTHFKLPEKTLNPITAKAVASILEMPVNKLENVVIGKQFVDKSTGKLVDPGTPNSISGGPALEIMLGNVNVEEDLKQSQSILKDEKNPLKIDKLNKKIKYLKSLKQNKMEPTDYLISNVLVTPSKFRPVFMMSGGDGAVIMSDINDLYQQTAHTSIALKGLKKQLDESVPNEDIKNIQLAEPRGQLYQDLKSIVGLQEPTSYLNRIKDKKGFITQIDGGKKQTKEGFFQSKVLERRQDLVGRSTIILNPELGGDQIGIPKLMASKIFRPFIMKKLVEWGYKPLEAQKEINDETEVFKRARQVVADERIVIANRAPTLHKYNMTSFKPILTEGKSIEMPAVSTNSNFNGDFDGDTFQIHVPISAKAIAEAEKMKPSGSMLKTGYDTVLNMPQVEMVVGSWLVSKGKGGKDTGLKLDSLKEARELFKNNKLSYADSVTIDGKTAPFGMHEINSAAPDDLKKYDIELNKKNIESWIRDVTKKHNGKIALSLADKIKDVGNNYVTQFGFTLGVSDTVSDKDIKDPLIDYANKKIKKGDTISLIKAYAEVMTKGREHLAEKLGENTMLGIGIKSGGSKGIDNVSAINLMPGIVVDSSDRPIPLPITKSYSEGLDTFGYWSAAHGARSGAIKKSVSTSMPGWLTKDLINSVYETRINSDTPADTVGLEYSIEDKKAILNRYLARDVKDEGGKIIAKRNDVINSDVINKINQHGIKNIYVQSPLTDPTPGDGFSSYSYGVDYEGKRNNVGDNVGIKSAHTITESSTNMALKAFHTGGALQVGKKSTGTVFDKLFDTLKFSRNNPDKATVSSMDGIVKNIKKSPIGGWDIHVTDGKNEDIRYVSANNDPVVKPGNKIKAGDILSTGTPSAHDILKYKGMPETQKFIVDQIDGLTDGKLDKREIETIVRGITNTTRIMDPGTHPNFIKGDTAPLSTIDYYNNNNFKEEDTSNILGDHLAQNYGNLKKHTKIDENVLDKINKMGFKRVNVFKDRIKHEPFLTPNGIGAKGQISEDWISRLAHSRIARVLEEGTTQGWRTDITPVSNPVTQYVTGVYNN